MCRDDPGWAAYMGLLESLFVRHPLRLDIAGSPESIRKIDVETLARCHRTFYAPRNMILFVVGDLDGDEVLGFVGERSNGASAAGPSGSTAGAGPDGSEIPRAYPEEPPEVARPEFSKQMEVALPKVLMGFKEVGAPAAGPEFLQRELISEFALDFLFGRSSDGFQRLYEAGLIFDDFGASFHSCAGVAYCAVGGETPKPREMREAVLAEILRVREQGFPTEDFERQKRKFIGSFIRHFNSLEYIAGNYTYFRFHGVDLFDAVDSLGAMRREEVEERLRSLDPSRCAVSTILPKSGCMNVIA